MSTFMKSFIYKWLYIYSSLRTSLLPRESYENTLNTILQMEKNQT